MMTTRGRRAGCLAAAIGAALLAPPAMADQAGTASEREQQLEARVAELERLVSALLAQQQETSAQVQAQAAASAPPPAGKAPIQRVALAPSANPGTTVSVGGFIKADAMWTATDSGEIPDGSTGRLFYVPSTIPVGPDSGADEDTDLDMHAQFSRFWVGTDTVLDSGRTLKSYFEWDLFGGALGNEISTNTYGLTIRHAYFGIDRWLFGQTWSNFQDVAALPDAVDFVGPTEGTIFVRQAQVRYTNGPWSVSAENPESILTPFGGGARISSDDNSLPDLTVRYLHKGDWGHFTAAALVRQLKHETPAGGDSIATGALSVSGKFNVGSADDLRWMVNYGALGRYVGFGLNNDGMLDASGDIESLEALTGFVAWRHVFSPSLRGNLFYSFAEYDNDVALTGTGATESAQSFHANMIWSPVPKVDLGVEYILGERELESGVDGDLQRLHFHARYSF